MGQRLPYDDGDSAIELAMDLSNMSAAAEMMLRKHGHRIDHDLALVLQRFVDLHEILEFEQKIVRGESLADLRKKANEPPRDLSDLGSMPMHEQYSVSN